MSYRTVALSSLRTRSDCALLLYCFCGLTLLNIFSPSGIECLGAHLGDPQAANLGDGNGWVNQTLELRQDYGNPDIGTCWESLVGGNHLRLFRQNGPSANSGALFLAFVCYIAPAALFATTNRMEAVFPRKKWSLLNMAQATGSGTDRFCVYRTSATATILLRTVIILAGEYTPASCTRSDGGTASRCSDRFASDALGVKTYQGVTFNTVAENLTGLLPPGSTGVNHGMGTTNVCNVIVDQLVIGIATDGVTVLLTVTIVS